MKSESSDKLDLILAELTQARTEIRELRIAVNRLAHSKAEALLDDDGWTRFPPSGKRCPVTGMSRSEIVKAIANNTLRKKKRGEKAYFSATDWRKSMAA